MACLDQVRPHRSITAIPDKKYFTCLGFTSEIFRNENIYIKAAWFWPIPTVYWDLLCWWRIYLIICKSIVTRKPFSVWLICQSRGLWWRWNRTFDRNVSDLISCIAAPCQQLCGNSNMSVECDGLPDLTSWYNAGNIRNEGNF